MLVTNRILKNGAGLTFVYDKEKKRKPFVSLIPLLEILLEINNHSLAKAQAQYDSLIINVGTEFDILLTKSYENLEKKGSKILRDAIQIVRERKICVDPGYDGVFGVVKIFGEKNEKSEEKKAETQPTLF